MPVTLPPILPPTRSGRSFFFAAAILGVLAGLQLIAFGVYLVQMARKSGAPTVAVSSPAPTLPAIAASPTAAASLPTPAPTPAPSIARPTPAVAERSASNPNDLLDQARQSRQSGDTNTALARLRDAQAIAPDSPMLIAETALTYEAMGLNDRAFEQWQRLYDQGEAVGALYYMAEARIHHVPTGAAGRAPEADDGFQESSVLKIVNLALEERSDPDAEKKLALKISVKNKPGFMIDPRRVKIEARFYDLLDGKDVVITNAVTGFAWLTAPVNWANDQTEILETTYLRPKIDPAAVQTPAPAPAATPAPKTSRRGRNSKKAADPAPEAAPSPPPAPAPVRTYLGFSVCLYYNGQLQDQQATPVRLLQQFPPPLTLSSE